MPDLLDSVDPDKSYLVSGEVLNALIANANQWANFRVEYGEKLEIVRGDGNAVLTIPTPLLAADFDAQYYNFQNCGGGCSSGIFLVEAGSEGT
jgi:hypothetical protein